MFNKANKSEISTSIITAKPRENAESLCEKLNISADLLVCGDDHQHGKPHAYIAESVFEKFDLVPNDVVYVGDMAVDFQFAINAGMQFIYFDGNGLNRLPVNIVNEYSRISCLTELLDYLPQ